MLDPFLTNERNKTIYEMRNDGATYDSIAEKYGVTRERVRQLYEKYKRKLDNIRCKNLSGTRMTVNIMRHHSLIMFSNSNMRKFKDNEEADNMMLQKLSNLIEVYSEVMK